MREKAQLPIVSHVRIPRRSPINRRKSLRQKNLRLPCTNSSRSSPAAILVQLSLCAEVSLNQSPKFVSGFPPKHREALLPFLRRSVLASQLARLRGGTQGWRKRAEGGLGPAHQLRFTSPETLMTPFPEPVVALATGVRAGETSCHEEKGCRLSLCRQIKPKAGRFTPPWRWAKLLIISSTKLATDRCSIDRRTKTAGFLCHADRRGLVDKLRGRWS